MPDTLRSFASGFGALAGSLLLFSRGTVNEFPARRLMTNSPTDALASDFKRVGVQLSLAQKASDELKQSEFVFAPGCS